jgi:hypothetical protein
MLLLLLLDPMSQSNDTSPAGLMLLLLDSRLNLKTDDLLG